MTKLKAHWSTLAVSPTLGSSGQTPLFLYLVEESIRFRTPCLLLVLFVLTAFNAAFGGKKAPKLAETIDLPPTFGADFSSQQISGHTEVHKGKYQTTLRDALAQTSLRVW